MNHLKAFINAHIPDVSAAALELIQNAFLEKEKKGNLQINNLQR